MEARDLEASERVFNLQAEIEGLRSVIAKLEKEKRDLQVIIEMHTEHSDAVEEELLEKIDKSLRENEKRFRLISETVPLPILVIRERDLAIIFANTEAARFFVIGHAKMIGLEVPDALLIPDSESTLRVFREGGIISRLEFRGVKRTGEEFWVSLSAHPIVFDDSRCFLCAFFDLTERKRSEEQIYRMNEELEGRVLARTAELSAANEALMHSLDQLEAAKARLVEAEKLEALDFLVVGVAHELNTPIGIGITSSSFLADQMVSIREQFEKGVLTRSDLAAFLNSAFDTSMLLQENLKRTALLVESFKKLAVQRESDSKTRVELGAYARDILQVLAHNVPGKKVSVELDCPEPIEVMVDSQAFSHIFAQLFQNSVQHGFGDRDSGRILVAIRREEDSGSCLVEFSDDGGGVCEDVLPHLFEPFVTTKRGGGSLGLGLNIVYNLIKKADGSIECSREESGGTAFKIHLPCLPGPTS